MVAVEHIASLDEHVRVREVRGDLLRGHGFHDRLGEVDVLGELTLRQHRRWSQPYNKNIKRGVQFKIPFF